LTDLRGIGPARAKALRDAGFDRASQLLYHLPFRYEDRSRIVSVSDLDGEGGQTLVGCLQRLTDIRSRRRGVSLVKGWIEDSTGRLPVVWFNRPYLRRQVEEGREYLVYGQVRRQGQEALDRAREQIVACAGTRMRNEFDGAFRRKRVDRDCGQRCRYRGHSCQQFQCVPHSHSPFYQWCCNSKTPCLPFGVFTAPLINYYKVSRYHPETSPIPGVQRNHRNVPGYRESLIAMLKTCKKGDAAGIPS
jgi:hypothetical protein